jgi:putative transposase
MLWARMVAYVTGTVNQELLLRNEYLGAENRILRGQIKGGLLLSEGEKATLAEIAQRLGRKALEELAAVAKPDTLLTWYRKLIANKFDGSKFRSRQRSRRSSHRCSPPPAGSCAASLSSAPTSRCF